jgi:hypothetical protein
MFLLRGFWTFIDSYDSIPRIFLPSFCSPWVSLKVRMRISLTDDLVGVVVITWDLSCNAKPSPTSLLGLIQTMWMKLYGLSAEPAETAWLPRSQRTVASIQVSQNCH